ncbi:MAG: Na/Pi cotransporter family protein [Lentisphaeria bacterium]|nr:Na/Pi cotransporter family protein [Lentisphaeria bacterium]
MNLTQTIMTVFGGLAIFIFGMKMMSDGLHHVAGERMRSILRMFSNHRLIAVISGATVTCVIQSSSASTVMVIGFINAGLLTLTQAVGLIFGANIGTTITAQLVAFNIAWIIMPSIFLGLLMSFVPMPRIAKWSETILGFGFLFLGMQYMSETLKRLAENDAFRNAFQTFQCAPSAGEWMIPLFSMLGAIAIGIIATFLIQSSSACTGIIIALGASGLVDLYTAVALVMGSNIGTTVTAQLAAIAANRVAKQAALAHTLFNIVGVIIVSLSFLIPWQNQPAFFAIIEWLSPSIGEGTEYIPRQIANAHTLFNVFTTVVLFPFIPLFAKVCQRIIPVKDAKVKYQQLEPHLLDTPPIALAQTTSSLRQMLKKAWKMIDCAINIYLDNNEKNQAIARQLEKREADIDERQKDITGYLAQLMRRDLTPREAEQIPVLLHCTNDTERIGDHTALIRAITEKLNSENLRFSQEAEEEFKKLHSSLTDLANAAINILVQNDEESRANASILAEKIFTMLENSEAKHLARINNGDCRPQVGILYLELLEEIRKISRHLENINDRAGMLYTKLPKAAKQNP